MLARTSEFAEAPLTPTLSQPSPREGRGEGGNYSDTGCSEICQSLPSKTEMWSVFIGE